MRILTADAAQSLVAATLGAIGLTYACSAPPSGGDQRRHAPLANGARSAAGGIIEEALTAEELRQRCGSAGVSEEALDAVKGKPQRGAHNCSQEGCWHQLGVGHKLEPMQLRNGEQQVCSACGQEARFALRAGAQFGWGHRAEAQQMLRGLGRVCGTGVGNQWVSSKS